MCDIGHTLNAALRSGRSGPSCTLAASSEAPIESEPDLSRIRTLVAVAAIALPIPAVAGCGGSSSNSEDPQQVLDQTFNNPQKVTSGNVALSVQGTAQGSQSGNFSATISGPF